MVLSCGDDCWFVVSIVDSLLVGIALGILAGMDGANLHRVMCCPRGRISCR